MSSRRTLQALPVPTGPRALDVLPPLRDALDGTGPALLPVAAHEPDTHHVAETLRAGTPLADDEDDDTDPTALVVATSGSTGVPKGVLLSAGALRASANATHDRLGGPGRWLLAMPAHHVAGLQVLVRSLVAGTTPGVVDARTGFRTDGFTAAAAPLLDDEGPHYTALVPTQLTRLLDAATHDDENGLAALRKFDAVLLGGAATPPTLLNRARDAGVRVVTTYGMSETAGGCVYDGAPLDGTRAHVDPSGAISLTGPTLARGYRGNREATAPAFADGWFHTGDLGTWRDGALEVLGRADDVIVTGGVNVAPTPVERALTEHPAVREACVFDAPDAEWGQIVAAAIVPADTSAPPPAEELRTTVRERCGAPAAPKHITFVDQLPLRGPGKPDRDALREALTR